MQDIWNFYKNGSYLECLEVSVTRLLDHSGMDLIHAAGLALMKLKRFDESLTLLKAAATFRPNALHIYANSALLCQQYEFHKESAFFCDIGLEMFPDNLSLKQLKANYHVLNGDYEQAIKFYKNVVAVIPDDSRAHTDLGNTYRRIDMFDEAVYHLEKALELDPSNIEANNGRAIIHYVMGQIDEAIALLEPMDNPNSKYILCSYMLAKGEFKKGWELHNARWGSYMMNRTVRGLRPATCLDDIIGTRLLVTSEGGLGDSIHFFRYLPMLSKYAKVVFLLTTNDFIPLLGYNVPRNVKLCTGIDISEYDYSITYMDCPYFFNTTLYTIPNKIPFIKVPEREIKNRQLPPTTKKRVGLVWTGGETAHYNTRRSIDFKEFTVFEEFTNDIEFINLQFGERGNVDGLSMTKVLTPNSDWLHTAAIVAQLDLIISVDTSVVHLAAGMGKKVWLLSRTDCDWRWLRNDPETPWYPKVVRVFGQKKYNEWTSTVAWVKAELVKWIKDNCR